MVDVVSVFCYTNTPAKRKDIFNLKNEHVGILRAYACIDTHTCRESYAGDFECVKIILSG